MRKILLLVFISVFSLISITNGQGLEDRFNDLEGNITFGYTTTQKISVKTIDDQKVTIESPLIKNNNQNVINYTLMYSEYPLIEILEQTDLLNQTKEKLYELTNITDPFTMELGLIDNIDPTKKYYLFIVPKDNNNNLGEVSNEIRFSITDKTYGDAGSNEVSIFEAQQHNAAGADMTLADISHRINGNTITLTWISINGSDKIDISVLSPGTTTFSKVATVNMFDESYSFVANRNGEYVFQFTPNNGGIQVNYTLNINTISGGGTTGPAIPVVPKTGPTENAIVIIIGAFLGYLIYKRLYRKAK